MTGTWLQAEGGKKGSVPSRETAADVGMRKKAQGRAAEASGWRVRATPRWEVLHTGRGGGERVKKEDFDYERLQMGGGGRKEERK